MSIPDILTMVTRRVSSEPSETIILNKNTYTYSEDEDTIFIYGCGGTFKFAKKNYSLRISNKKIEVFRFEYFCNATQTIIPNKDMYGVNVGYALNKYVAARKQHSVYDLQRVHYIKMNTNAYPSYAFVFKIADTREAYAETANNLFRVFPPEVVCNITSFLKCDRPKENFYTAKDFPFDRNFVQEYSGEIPDMLSKYQIMKLLECGAICPAADFARPFDSGSLQCILLTDESYDHVYPNNAPNRLHDKYRTKEQMHEQLGKFITNFFINV